MRVYHRLALRVSAKFREIRVEAAGIPRLPSTDLPGAWPSGAEAAILSFAPLLSVNLGQPCAQANDSTIGMGALQERLTIIAND